MRNKSLFVLGITQVSWHPQDFSAYQRSLMPKREDKSKFNRYRKQLSFVTIQPIM